jgi:hypothetical protein
MNKQTWIYFLLAVLALGICPKVYGQVYEETDLTFMPQAYSATSGYGKVEEYCETVMVDAATQMDYEGVTADCTMSSPQGETLCESEEVNPETECQMTVSLQPAFVYNLQASGELSYVYYSDDDDYIDLLDYRDATYSCSGTTSPPPGPCTISPGSNGGDETDDEGLTLPTMSVIITAMEISPNTANLFQTQSLSLASNYLDPDWCGPQETPGTCSGGAPPMGGEGTLTSQGGYYAEFIAPDSIEAIGGETYLNEYACASDPNQDENWACTNITLNQFIVTLTPQSPQVLSGGVTNFVASVPTTTLPVSWSWTLNPNIGTGSLTTTCTAPCVQETWAYTAPSASGQTTVTAQAAVTVPNGATLTAEGSTQVTIEGTPTITFDNPYQNVGGVVGSGFTLAFNANVNVGSASSTWSLTGATGLVSCTKELTQVMSCNVIASASSNKIIQASVCLTPSGGGRSFCSTNSATVVLSPLCTVGMIRGTKEYTLGSGGLLEKRGGESILFPGY